ncbi:heterogeneous nuclear ribonucleoprotein A0 [Trifolium repens]|nr:heterogeneous nuclear ribonucleoprotein A0 [Trifolium repens]
MRERGRERVRGVASRAYLGRPFRSPPSPEVRHKWGSGSITSGEWTEVRNRRRKALRQGTKADNRSQQNHVSPNQRAMQHPKFFESADHHDRTYGYFWRDHSYDWKHQTRFGRDGSSDFHQVSNYHHRSHSIKPRGRDVAITRHMANRPVSRTLSSNQHQFALNRDRHVRIDVEEGQDHSRGRITHGCRKKDHIMKHHGRGPRLSEYEVAPLGTTLKRYVSFYFTNFPAHMSIFYLRKGFEVCGILEDVYVARNRNRYGEPYGFVKFSNVRDVAKMTKALNAVWFGQFRVRASVAKFDRNAPGVEGRMEEGQFSLPNGAVEKLDGHQSPTRRKVTIQGGDPRPKPMVTKSLDGNAGTLDLDKEGSGVRVGEIVLNLANRQQRPVQITGGQHKGKLAPKVTEVLVDTVKGKESSMFLRNYRSKPEDAQWVLQGLVATVNNGEAIPVVQNRISDAGFGDLVIIPMGADKVFIRRTEGGDAMDIVGGAEEFFNLVFSNWMRWEKGGRPYQRGAWVRLYGVPLNAWNVEFFKLCVFDCGRFVRADSCSAERDRLDFARVLIATSDLSIVTRVERVLVDGVQVDIKIVEEWGYAMGEDTCLFAEEDDSGSSQADEGLAPDVPDVGRHVDVLVDNLVNVDEVGDGAAFQRQSGDETPSNKASAVGDSEEKESWNEVVLSPALDRPVAVLDLSVGNHGGSTFSRTAVSSPVSASQGRHLGRLNGEGDGTGGRSHPRCSRATSCPPSEDREALSGPWSWEWLRDHNHEGAGVIFSASKRARMRDPSRGGQKRAGHPDTNNMKAGGGVLRHPVHSLKKIARLPTKDRGEALKALGRCVRRRRAGPQANNSDSASSETSDNDWRNWVAVHGNDQVAMEDIRGIGQTIGVTFRGDKENMFNVLSRPGNSKGEISSHSQRTRSKKEKSC